MKFFEKLIALNNKESGKGNSEASKTETILEKIRYGSTDLTVHDAAALIQENIENTEIIVNNLQSFNKSDHLDIFIEIFKIDDGATYLEKYQDNISLKELTLRFIEKEPILFKKYIENFKSVVSINDILNQIIEKGHKFDIINAYISDYISRNWNKRDEDITDKIDISTLRKIVECYRLDGVEAVYTVTRILNAKNVNELLIEMCKKTDSTILTDILPKFIEIINREEGEFVDPTVGDKLLELDKIDTFISCVKVFNVDPVNDFRRWRAQRFATIGANKFLKNYEYFNFFIKHIGYFYDEFDSSIANKLIDTGNIALLKDNISRFANLDSTIATKIFDKNNISDSYEFLEKHIEKFSNLEPKFKLEIILNTFSTNESLNYYNYDRYYENKNKGSSQLFFYENSFTLEEIKKILNEEEKNVDKEVLENIFSEVYLKKITMMDFKTAEVLDKNFTFSKNNQLIQKILFEKIEDRLFRGYADKQEQFPIVDKIIEHLPFPLEYDKVKELFVKVSDNNFHTKVYLNNLDKKPIDSVLRKTTDIFRELAGNQEYQIIKSINDGIIPEEVKMFSVTHTGPIGINQLEQGLNRFRSKMFEQDFNTSLLQENLLAKNYFLKQIRFDEAEWKGEGHSFEEMVNRYVSVTQNSKYEIAPLNPEFTPSEVLYIDKVSKSTESIQYTESFLNRFKVILDDVKKAQKSYLNGELFGKTIEIIEKKINSIKESFKNVIEGQNPVNNKGLPLSEQQKEIKSKNLKTKLNALEALELRNIKNFQENFKTLAGYKELESELRQTMFIMGFAKNRTQLTDKPLNFINTEKPTIDDITWVMNFVDHITNKETMSKYFTDLQARNKFKELINIKSFEEELSRFQNQEKKGILPMKFIPTRGVLMEFSGHIADACWADKYEQTIPVELPNFTAVTMVQNPESVNERICGSCMLIETENKETGEGLLVIRGLNPIQNTINRLSVENFYKKFTEYTKTLAKKTNKKIAIVVDHSGGASTNRPLLANYLESLKLQKVVVPYEETEFNGYNITNKTYLVE